MTKTMITKDNGVRKLPLDEPRLKDYIKIVAGIDDPEYAEKALRGITVHPEYSADSISDSLEKLALEQVDETNWEWNYKAAKLRIDRLYKRASQNRGYDKEDKYGDFLHLIEVLTEMGIYSPKMLQQYSNDEIRELGNSIIPERDYLFDYQGLYMLENRYLATGHDKEVYELPQERWMVIAMYLMQSEHPEFRMERVKEAYWALSGMYMTVATPTLKNAGLAHGQLSSCFIDTVSDDLRGIYDSNTDIAQLSKWGGGIGVYMGKVRAKGGSIRGYSNMSSGVIPWIKQLNNTAVSVDQLGYRIAPCNSDIA